MQRGFDMVISPKGEVKMEAVGYSGDQCLRATADLEAILGGDIEREEKPEMHESVEEAMEMEFEGGDGDGGG